MIKSIVTCRHKREVYAREVIEEIFGCANYEAVQYLPSVGKDIRFLAQKKKSEITIAIIDVHDDRNSGGIFKPSEPAISYAMFSHETERLFLPLLEALLKNQQLPYTSIYLGHVSTIKEYPIVKPWSFSLFREDFGWVYKYDLQSVLLSIELVNRNRPIHKEHLSKFFNMLEEQL